MSIFKGFENAQPPEITAPGKLDIEGEIPPNLRGVLYRNGPGQFTIHNDRYQHLFDGDGLATRIAFEDDGAYYTSRFVATEEKKEEDRAGKRIYGTYATRPVGGFVKRFLHREFKNVSNTNLVYQWNHAFSLYEGGPPYRLDPTTLETIGPELFDGKLADQQKISAHPHRDPKTGDLWNFGITRKKETTITVYNMKDSGAFEVPFQFGIPYSGILHDFAMTPGKLIFVVPPVKLPKIPIGVILGQRCFYESLAWYPDERTIIVIIDRETGNLSKVESDTFMNFHVANAFEEGGALHIDLCNFEDFSVMRSMSELIAGQQPKGGVSYLERLTVTGDTVERKRLSDHSMEFPRVAEAGFGTKRRFYFGASWGDRDWISVPMRVDSETGETQLCALKPNEFGGEPVPVPKQTDNFDSVYLLFTVLDTDTDTNAVWIVDGDDLAAPPLAKLTLPQRIPFPLHGNWIAR